MFKMLIQKFSGAKVRTKKRPRTSGAIWERFGNDLVKSTHFEASFTEFFG